MIVYGINPVLEALRAGRVKALRVARRDDERMRELLAFASTRDCAVNGSRNDVLTGRRRAASIRASSPTSMTSREYSVEDLVRGASEPPR